jgi:hypothetical protein
MFNGWPGAFGLSLLLSVAVPVILAGFVFPIAWHALSVPVIVLLGAMAFELVPIAIVPGLRARFSSK